MVVIKRRLPLGQSIETELLMVCVYTTYLHLDPKAINSPYGNIWTGDVSSDSLAWIKTRISFP